MYCSTPGLPVPHHLLKFAQAHVHSIADIIQPSHPLMPSSPSALSLSQYQRPSNESAVFIRRPKYGSFSFSISPSDEYSLLIFLMIDWFDLLAVQGTFRSLLQHHSSKASILWHSAFFIVQFSNLAWLFTHNGISLSYKNEILPFSTAWVDLEDIVLTEISHTEKEKYMHLLIQGIIKYTNISKWKKTHRSEKKLVIVREEWDGGWWNKWNGLRGTSLQILNKYVIGI